MDTKTCTKCGETKPVSEFYRRSDRPVGLLAKCKTCSRAARKKWADENADHVRQYREANRDRQAAYVREWQIKNADKVRSSSLAWYHRNSEAVAAYRAENAERIREYEKRWRHENRERLRDVRKRWRLANPDKTKAYSDKWREANRERYIQVAVDAANRRRARLRGLPAERVDRKYVIARDKARCHFCGKKCKASEIHLDHLIPVAWNDAEHSARNVRVACSACNLKSGAGKMTAQLLLFG